VRPIHGVMWCIAHDGISDERNDGTVCDRSDDGSAACELRDLYFDPLTGDCETDCQEGVHHGDA